MALFRYHDHDGVGGNLRETMCGKCKYGTVDFCPAKECNFEEE